MTTRFYTWVDIAVLIACPILAVAMLVAVWWEGNTLWVILWSVFLPGWLMAVVSTTRAIGKRRAEAMLKKTDLTPPA